MKLKKMTLLLLALVLLLIPVHWSCSLRGEQTSSANEKPENSKHDSKNSIIDTLLGTTPDQPYLITWDTCESDIHFLTELVFMLDDHLRSELSDTIFLPWLENRQLKEVDLGVYGVDTKAMIVYAPAVMVTGPKPDTVHLEIISPLINLKDKEHENEI